HALVLGPEDPRAEDELRLPRPPGVIRRYWARHPRFADVLIMSVALLLTVPSFALLGPAVTAPAMALTAAILHLLACVALLWRRRHPVAVLIATLVPLAAIDPAVAMLFGGPAPPIALYSVAVYRGARAALLGLAASIGLPAAVTLGW